MLSGETRPSMKSPDAETATVIASFTGESPLFDSGMFTSLSFRGEPRASMKKISRRNTTSTRGVISMAEMFLSLARLNFIPVALEIFQNPSRGLLHLQEEIVAPGDEEPVEDVDRNADGQSRSRGDERL